MSQSKKMLLGVALGTVLGVLSNALFADATALQWIVTNVTQPLGQVFLRLLFMLVLPLLFSALVVGVSELPLKDLGRVARKTFVYTIVVSSVAVLIGLTTVNVLRPGDGISDAVRQAALAGGAPKAAQAPQSDASAMQLIVNIIPDNIAKSAATGDMLGWLAFSLIFGIGLAMTQSTGADRLKEAISGLYDTCMTLIGMVMRFAPIGVGALLFSMTARLGTDLLLQLLAYVGTVLLALSLHMFVVYPISVRFFGGRSPVQFFRDCRDAIVTAFSTSSSSATLPTALKVAEENLKLPSHVSRFVLTAGSTMNQNGTALFEGVTVLFIAQLFDVPLALGQQAVIMLICILAGIGTAGVPAGSIPVIAMILGMFNIPVEGLGLILGVDRLLDMCRTTLNVTGDLAAAVYVAKDEPHLGGPREGSQATTVSRVTSSA